VSDVESRRRSRRALVTFWVLTVACGLVGAAVVSPWHSPWLGVGAAVGAVLGTVVSVGMAVWPLVRALWHWLPELLVAAGLVAAGTWLVDHIGPWLALAVLAVPVVVVVAPGPIRRRVRALLWCVIVRHRLRMCFAAFIRARNRLDPGTVPLILTARPTPAGERVWVWLRTGLDVAELEAGAVKIAVTCWASEVQVLASRRFAALVRLDITRRDPLTGVVGSHLLDGIPGHWPAPVEVDPLMTLGLDLDDVPEEPTVEKAGRR
jgi:hypothetical protein